MLVVGCFTLAYLNRVVVIQLAAPKVAVQYGVDIQELEISQFDVNKIVISSLIAKYQDDSAITLIEVQDLVVEIDINKEHIVKVSNISLERLNIEIDIANANKSGDPSQSVKDVISRIPLIGLDVEQFEVAYLVRNELLARFSGMLLSFEQGLEIQGEVSAAPYPDTWVHLQLNESQISLQVTEKDLQEKIIDWSGEYEIDNDWLSLRMHGLVGVSIINQYMTHLDIDKLVKNDDSSIDIELDADLAAPMKELIHTLSMSVEMDSSLKISSKQLNLKNASVDVRMRCLLKALSSAECVIKQPQYGNVELITMPEWMLEYFQSAEKDYILEVNPSNRIDIRFASDGGPIMSVSGDANISLRSHTSQLQVESLFSEFNAVVKGDDWKLDGEYQVKLDANNLLQPIKASRVLLRIHGRLVADPQQVRLSINKEMNVVALDASYDNFSASKLELKQQSGARIQYGFDGGKIGVEELLFSLSAKQVRHIESEIESEPIRFKVEQFSYFDSIWNANATLASTAFSIKEQGVTAKGSGFDASINLKDNHLAATGTLRLGKRNSLLEFFVAHDISTGVGRGGLNANAIPLENNELIAQKISETGFPLQLNAGRLSVEMAANWQDLRISPEVLAILSLTQSGGDYAQNQFSNINAEIELVRSKGWKLVKPTKISIGSLNVGIPIDNIFIQLERLEYGVQLQPLLEIGVFSASVLDGSIYAEEIEVDLNRPKNNFSVHLSKLSLEKLLALNQIKDLMASGSLDGEFPILLYKGELLVNGGWLQADKKGGHIRYGRIGEVSAGNENLELVGKLLEGFQYNEMSAQVDLDSDGELSLATKLHGRSLNAELNEQVNLNFNIELNLWKFLERARLLTRID